MKNSGKRIGVVCLIILFVILVNAAAGTIVSKYNLKLDMTLSHLYSISQETEDLIKSLDKDVDIYVICQSRDSLTEFSELLNCYDAASDRLHVEYINPDTDLLFIDEYEKLGLDISLNSIIVECGDNRRLITLYDMYQFSTDGSLVLFNGEAMITSAIMNVVNEITETVAVLMGHGEDVPASLESQLIAYGYDVQGLVLNKNIPQETGCLMILAPQSDFSETELEYLEEYLNRGGSILYFKDASMKELPNLDGLLDEWGIRFEYKAVMDSSYNINSNPMYVIANYIDNDFNEYFKNQNYYVVVPVANSIDPDFTNSTNAEVTVVLSSSDYAYARAVDTDNEDNSLSKQATDEDGPFVLAVISQRAAVSEDARGKIGKIFALGSSYFYSDEMMESTSLGNSAYIKEAVSWAVGNNDMTYQIAGKQVGAEPLSVTSRQIRILSVVLIGIIPVSVIGIGIVIVVKRRYL